MKIDGKKIAQEIAGKLKIRPAPKKIFAAVLVGNDSASASFLKKKEETARELGVDFRLYEFDGEIKNDELRKEVGKLSGSRSVRGVIIQLPLPKHLNRHYVLNAISREKDVDALGERALGAFYAGRSVVLPPAAGTAKEIIEKLEIELKTARAAVIGRGILVGRPISLWLQDRVAELAVFSSQTENLKEKLKDFDIIISGAGKANLFSAEDAKKNALIIDFGYDFKDGKIFGDFNPENADSVSYTPTPGGTGPILVAKLFENFYELNKEE
jgi:methylenetetrahydrofolate dehydrogenase (NADP+)/methenyltetrahydrofolate cyclohydrolase